MAEQPTIRNVAHEQLDDNAELVDRLVETGSRFRRRCPSNCLLKVRVRIGVVQLDCLDAAEIVMVSRVLRVASGRGEGCFRDELVRLVVEGVVEVGSEEAVDE